MGVILLMIREGVLLMGGGGVFVNVWNLQLGSLFMSGGKMAAFGAGAYFGRGGSGTDSLFFPYTVYM